MRARPEIRPHLIAARMQRWLNIARCPLVDIRVPTWKARRNYRALVRRYPQIVARLRYSEALSYPSPLHGLPPVEPPLIDSPAPVQEQPPAAASTPAYASPAMIRKSRARSYWTERSCDLACPPVSSPARPRRSRDRSL
jgi:hypothetical protein